MEESVTEAVGLAIERAHAFHGLRGKGREATRAAHREIVDQTKELLAARFRERLTMGEIAAAIGVSRFHLSRVFRSSTGFSLHGYRNQLRLRAALERIADRGRGCPRSPRSSASRATATSRRPSASHSASPRPELRGRVDRTKLQDVSRAIG